MRFLNFTLLLSFLSTGIAQSENIVVSPGNGAEGIQVGQSTEQDVVTKYGNQYQKIKHLNYSYQLKYPELDMSFYYCQNDPLKKLFTIEYLQGSTNDGIIIGKSTLADVQNLHKEIKDYTDCDSGLCAYQYDGITYFTKDSPETDSARLTIIEIDVQPLSFKDCDSNLRSAH